MAISGAPRPRLATGAGTAGLCVLATAAIVLQQEIRTPLHLPGHRGLVWLALLVAVRLVAGRPGPALAVGVASSALTAGLGLSPDGALGALPYVLAGFALDAAGLLPGIRSRGFALAAMAAPVHLVALVVPVGRSLLAGVEPAVLAQGLGGVALLHLAFGAAAGLLGWGLATVWNAASS